MAIRKHPRIKKKTASTEHIFFIIDDRIECISDCSVTEIVILEHGNIFIRLLNCPSLSTELQIFISWPAMNYGVSFTERWKVSISPPAANPFKTNTNDQWNVILVHSYKWFRFVYHSRNTFIVLESINISAIRCLRFYVFQSFEEVC